MMKQALAAMKSALQSCCIPGQGDQYMIIYKYHSLEKGKLVERR